MNSALASLTPEARWNSYAKAAGFLVPAVLLWSFATVFLVPKLQMIWSAGAGPASDAQWLMDGLRFLIMNGALVMWTILLALVLIEWLVRPWARYRRAALGTLVFLLNTVVLLGLTVMCVAALLIAPALMQAR